jgi:hypothetical protein
MIIALWLSHFSIVRFGPSRYRAKKVIAAMEEESSSTSLKEGEVESKQHSVRGGQFWIAITHWTTRKDHDLLPQLSHYLVVVEASP